jgi:hypothetical protein
MPARKARAGAKKTARRVKEIIGARVKITVDNSLGTETLSFETPLGQTITLSDIPGAVRVGDSNGNSLRLDAAGVTIESATRVTINAGEVKINAGTARFSGIVQCETLISNAVVSASYTPGAGNIW